MTGPIALDAAALLADYDAALLRTAAQRDAYRQALCAALDKLSEAHAEIERQRRMIAEMREERERYARSIFTQSVESDTVGA